MTPLHAADRFAAWRNDQRARQLEALRVTNPARYRVVMFRLAEMLEAKADPAARDAGRHLRAQLEPEGTP